jgi:hypothetical protein
MKQIKAGSGNFHVHHEGLDHHEAPVCHRLECLQLGRDLG